MFRLRFPEDEVTRLAARYHTLSEAGVENELGPAVRDRGYLTLADLVQLGEWKSPRIRSRCAANDAAFVESVTRTAFATPDERLRIEILTLLRGVAWPMASVILHWCHTERYPILDYRALWSLEAAPARYDFAFWQLYTAYCRDLADRAGVTMRMLDRALWQYSKENQ